MQKLSCFSEFTILAAEKLSVMNAATLDHVQPLCTHRFKVVRSYTIIYYGGIV